MTAPVVHRVLYFVGGVAWAACSKYVDSGNVTAYPKEVTCKKCRRKRC